MTKDNPISKDLLRVKPTPRKIKGPRDQKKLYVLMIFLIVALVSAVVVSLIFGHKASKSKTKTSIPTPPAKEEMKNENKNEEEIDTSDWLTYENKEYGYKLRYPKKWRIKEISFDEVIFIDLSEEEEKKLDDEFQRIIKETGGVDILPQSDFYKIWIKIQNVDSNFDIQKWLTKEYALPEDYPMEKIMIAGKSGIFIDNLEWVRHLIASVQILNNKIMLIEKYLDGKNDNYNLKLFKKIISTIEIK